MRRFVLLSKFCCTGRRMRYKSEPTYATRKRVNMSPRNTPVMEGMMYPDSADDDDE
jgi:hypothetical protein